MAALTKNKMMKIALMRDRDFPTDLYCDVLSSLGTVQCLPPLSFNFINLDQLSAHLAAPHRWKGLIFTSKRAVQALKQVDAYLLPWKSKPCFVVGNATWKAAEKVGLNCIGSESGCGSQLGEVIKKSSHKGDLPLLFVCNQLRRDELPQYLTNHNVAFETVIVYETIANEHLPVLIRRFIDDHHNPSHIVYFSPSGYKIAHPIWSNCLDLEANQVTMVAIGNTTASVMSGVALIADQPSPSAVLAAIVDASQQDGGL